MNFPLLYRAKVLTLERSDITLRELFDVIEEPTPTLAVELTLTTTEPICNLTGPDYLPSPALAELFD